VPLAEGLRNGITTIDVSPADQSHRKDVAQPAEGVVPDVRVVSNRECIRQVPKAARVDNEPGLDRNPMDLRVFVENVRELRCSDRPVPATKIGDGQATAT
jgi:hypothetical protein